MATLADKFTAAVTDEDEPRIHAASIGLLQLPSQALTDTGASRGRASRTRGRLERIDRGEAVDGAARPDVGAPDRAQRPNHELHKRAARAHRQLTLGSVTRAAKCVEALPIAEPTAATVELLRALHPAAPPPQVPAPTAAAVVITDEIFSDVLHALPKGSAPGPSGWTYEHIKAATQSRGPAFQAILRVINAIVSGALPHLPELLDSTLIALVKPGGGLRPIAIGEVWYRLAGLCAMAACPNAGPALAPLQLGIGVKGGSQVLGHAVLAHIAANPNCVLVKFDYENAFNELYRAKMLTAVSVRQPPLLPFAAWAYRQPSRLFVAGAPEGTAPIMSEAGVKQGDPLGGLLFGMTTQDALEATRQVHPGIAPAAYYDDTVALGESEDAVSAFATLRAHSAVVGLRLRLDKCGVYSPDQQAAADTSAALAIPHCVDGLVIAGTPVGTDAFIKAHASERADAICNSIDVLLETPLSAQDKFIILRSSAQMRIAHLQRVAPWGIIGDEVHRVEDKVAKAAFSIMQRPEHTAVRDGQLTLPLRLGGMGIRTTSALEARAAFVSAAAVTETVMRTGPQHFRPFAGPTGVSLSHDWQAVHAAGAVDPEHPLWAPEDLVLDADRIDSVLPGAQRTFSRFVAQRRFDELAASCDPANAAGKADLARLHGCSCRAASMWIETLPVSRALMLTDTDFRTAMRFRLGLTQMPSNAPGVRCDCGHYLLPTERDHALTCTRHGGTMTLRHNMITQDWRRIASRAGVSSSVEPEINKLPGFRAAPNVRPQSRGDILVVLPEGLTVCDVSVVHPAASTYVHKARFPGGAAAERDRVKTIKYHTADPNGYAFTPLSHETYGRLGKPAMQLLNTLSIEASASGSVHKGDFVTNALRQLSITMCRANGIMFRRSLETLAKVTGTNFAGGLLIPTSDVL